MPEESLESFKAGTARTVGNRLITFISHRMRDNIREDLISVGNETKLIEPYPNYTYFEDKAVSVRRDWSHRDTIRLGVTYSAEAAPMKWLCSGKPNHTCTQSHEGKYATEAECKDACKLKQKDDKANLILIVVIIIILVSLFKKG